MFLERLDDGRHGRFFLTHGDVHANDAVAFLVDDGIDGDGGLAGLAVADDQFALASPDRDHRVNGFDAGLHGYVHRLSAGDAGGLPLQRQAVFRLDHPFAVQRIAQRIDHSPEQGFAHRHAQQLTRTPNLIAFLNAQIVAQDHRADRILIEVEHLPRRAVLELQQFAGHGVAQSVDLHDAVAHLQHSADLRNVHLAAILLDLLLDDRRNFIHFELHCRFL